MKIISLILGLLNGGYMLLDGIYVILNGKYIGPEEPGPWKSIFQIFNINIFQLGPVFILFGILWLLWVYFLLVKSRSTFIFGVFLSVMTLWYFPIGTIFSLIILAILSRKNF